MKRLIQFAFVVTILVGFGACSIKKEVQFSGNPLFDSPLTADPSVLVHNDTLYLFTGSDEQAEGVDGFLMRRWYVFSTADMVNWKNHGPVLAVEDFAWASHNAFAGHVVENNGKFWWYVPMVHKDSTARVHEGFAIGVAVADHPAGPYHDPIGRSIIADTTANSIVLNIDPAVYVDDDEQVYFYCGSWGAVRVAKMNPNMTELAGPVEDIPGLTNFFEAPYIHKRGDTYYFTYSAGYPSRIEYATSKNINGPWEYRGVINDEIPNSPTNHQAIVTFKGNDYFFYHNAGSSTGGPFRRSVCVDKLEYDENGLIKKVVRTETGVPAVK